MSTIAMSCGIGGATLAEVLALADVPEAFEVGEWTLSDPGVGDRVQISINVLPSSLGSPLTRVQHNVDGAGWVDFLASPATGSFDIPVSFAVGQALNIAIRAQNATGAGASSDVKAIIPASPFSLTSTAGDEIEVDGTDGTITITIAAPSIYGAYDAGNGPGVFVVNSADKDAGPVNLVPPQISGGDNLTAGVSVVTTPGLWIYDGNATMPTTSYRWLRNGAPIPGETGTSYIVQAADVVQQVSVEEILAASNGTRAAISAPILTAGSIAQTNPTQGETLSVTGSNASTRASYQWQWNGVDVSGATSATFDTTNQPVGEYRRCVRDGMQGPVYTVAVTVAAAMPYSFTENAQGEIEIAGISGDITLTVTSPAIYADYDAGIFTFNSGDVVDSPKHLVPVRIAQTSAGVGDTIDIVPGLVAYDGDNDEPTVTRHVLRDGTARPGAVGLTYKVQALDQGRAIQVRETVTGGNGVSVSTSADIIVPTNYVVAHMGEMDVTNIGTATPTTQIDLTGRAAGDLLLIFYGADFGASGATVNGNMATPVQAWDFGLFRRGALFSHVLQQADIAVGTVDIVVTATQAGSAYALDFAISNGGSVGAATIFSNTNTVSITPTQADNTILHFLHGEGSVWQGTGVTFTDGATVLQQTATTGNHGAATSLTQNATAAPNTITFTIDGTGNYAGVAVVVEQYA